MKSLEDMERDWDSESAKARRHGLDFFVYAFSVVVMDAGHHALNRDGWHRHPRGSYRTATQEEVEMWGCLS